MNGESLSLRLSDWAIRNAKALKRSGLVAALIVFFGGLALSLYTVPDLLQRIDLLPFLALVFIATPVQAALNTAEFQLMARYDAHRIAWRPALEVTIYTSAGNILPLPGGIFVRLAAMRSYGSTLGLTSSLIALFFGIWGGLAFLVSGVGLLWQGQTLIGVSIFAVGVGLLIPCLFGCLRKGRSWALLGLVLLVRCAMLFLEAIRMLLSLYALSTAITILQGSIFVMTSFLGSFVAIVPAGFGIRETVAALLAPVIGVAPAIGFLSATVNRVAGMIGLAFLALVLTATSAKESTIK
jgi:uncharacterized membrane protein YbhN (UPF0104 family)